MKIFIWIVTVFLFFFSLASQSYAQGVCPRPQPGATVVEPNDLRSQKGVLEANLTANNEAETDGSARYCYTDAAGHESPNLRIWSFSTSPTRSRT
jgi:hypothetical protein